MPLCCISTNVLQRNDGLDKESGGLSWALKDLFTSAGNIISCMDWDIRGNRLALGFGKDHTDTGELALYSTTCQPVVSAQLIGKISTGADQPIQALKFHRKYQAGALLAIMSQSRQISIVPLLYTLT